MTPCLKGHVYYIQRVLRKSTSLTKSKRNTKYIWQWALYLLKIINCSFGHP
jgi:hypothetical protein